MGREAEESNYIIFKDGKLYKAKNGMTGCIEFSGTDAATVIQSAFDALPHSGGRILAKAGTFSCGARIYPDQTKPQIFEGNGPATVLEFDSAKIGGFFFGRTGTGETLQNIIFRNFKIVDINPTPTESFGIATGGYAPGGATTCKNIYIEHVEFKECGIHFHNVTTGHIKSCYLHDITTTGALRVGRSYDIDVSHNFVRNVYGMAIASGGPSYRIRITNNVVIDADQGNIGAYAIDVADTKDVLVEGNILHSNYGILSENGDGVIQYVGNIFIGKSVAKGEGYRVYRTASDQPQPDLILIAGNTASTCMHPCRVDDEDLALIIGNVFYNSNRGLNVSKNATWGVEPTKMVISRNLFRNCAMEAYMPAIYGGNLTTASIIGNVILGANKPNTFCIRGLGSGSRIIGNELSGYPTLLYEVVAGVEIKRNTGYVTENSGTATIAAGTTSVTVAHGLATTPTEVLVTPRDDIGDVWVSARDGTNITINCDTAPAADVIVDWRAEI